MSDASDSKAESAGSGDSEPFPRGTALPVQSPLFWVQQKDRYLRQLLIKDIEAQTGRRLVVYFANRSLSAQIDPTDPTYFVEMLEDARGSRLICYSKRREDGATPQSGSSRYSNIWLRIYASSSPMPRRVMGLSSV
jgi:hypothetical protein